MQPEGRRNYDEDLEIPRWLKWVFVSINRVGFPVVAFFCIWYLVTVSLKEMTNSLNRQSISLEALIVTVNANHSDSREWRDKMLADIERLREHGER